MGGTIGSRLAARIDAKGAQMPVDPMWSENAPVANVGYRAPITAKQIEAYAELEFERRTANGWRGVPCSRCFEVPAASGKCSCDDDVLSPGLMTLEEWERVVMAQTRLEAIVLGVIIECAADGCVTSWGASPEGRKRKFCHDHE